MILFKDVYKSANDSVNPPPELMEKILSNNVKRHNNYYGILKIAAAFLIFSGTLVMYPKINENINPAKTETIIAPPIVETKVSPEIVQKSIPEAEASSSAVVPPTPVPTKQAKKAVTPKKTEDLDASVTNDVLLASEPVILAEEEAIPEMTAIETLEEDSISSGGEVFKARAIMVSEHQAIAIADNEFISDFGEEFLSESELTVAYENGYTVTRKTTEIEASILVLDDGSFEKLY